MAEKKSGREVDYKNKSGIKHENGFTPDQLIAPVILVVLIAVIVICMVMH